MNKYFEALVGNPSERVNERVISVRQKGAQLENNFIIELAEKSKPALTFNSGRNIIDKQ